ncbi:hypothetical protein ACTVH1_17005 [Gluconobacter cerinus]
MAILSPEDLPAGPPLDKVNQKNCVEKGRAPDITLLEAGDIILYAPLKPNYCQKIIQKINGLQPCLPASAGEWTHAAISAGGDTIIEAVTRMGVRKASIFDDCFKYKILVRRANGLTKLERMNIALIAATNIEQRYDYYSALMIYMKTKWPGKFESFPHLLSSRTICSGLVATSFLDVTGLDIWPEEVVGGVKVKGVDTMNITPAHLSCAPTFSDVTIGWRPLVK